jgi:hypothetical protein
METPDTKGMELANKGGNYSPVHVSNNDTVGAAILGAIALLLLIALLRAQSRTRTLEKMLSSNA